MKFYQCIQLRPSYHLVLLNTSITLMLRFKAILYCNHKDAILHRTLNTLYKEPLYHHDKCDKISVKNI